MIRKVIPLAIGSLGLGLTEYVIMGLLPDIAHAEQIELTKAGNLISAYALGVVIGAPLLTFILLKKNYKTSLIWLMTGFVVFNVFTVFVPTYALLFIARLLTGLPHGAFFGIGAVLASKAAPPGKSSQAVAVMLSGLAFANLIGVPLGTYIGQRFGWETTYLAIAAIGVVSVIFIYKWVPSTLPENQTSPDGQLSFFTTLDFWLIVLMTSIGIGGLFCWISYISPLMTNVSGFGADKISLILMLAGVGMLVGSDLGGRIADRFGPSKALLYILILLGFSLWAVYLFSSSKPLSLLFTFTTGTLAYATVTPFQLVMMGAAAKGTEMIAGAVTHAAFNLGNALGAYLGGLPIDAGYDFTYPSLVGVLLTFIGAVLTIWHIKRRGRTEAAKAACVNS